MHGCGRAKANGNVVAAREHRRHGGEYPPGAPVPISIYERADLMKWYLLNAAQRFRFATKHPHYALKAVILELTFADERFLAKATGTGSTEIRRFLGEPAGA